MAEQRIPYNSVNINDDATSRTSSGVANLAEAGTLVMEWGTLADITGNKTVSVKGGEKKERTVYFVC